MTVSKTPAYTMTGEQVTFIWGGTPHIVKKGAPNFLPLRQAIMAEDWDAAVRNLTVAKSVQEWSRWKVRTVGDTMMYDGETLPAELSKRIMEMTARGEDPTSLFRFWDRLKKNPSMRSVQQLFPFLNHQGIPLTKDGTFLAYKSVREDYKDHHTGTVDNRIGVVNEMERNKISDDPNEACHFGFHVGALEYVETFGGDGSRIVICEVDPADVVCIPYDSSQHKMRVAKYKVIGHHNGVALPSTSYEDDGIVPFGGDEVKELDLDSMDSRQLMQLPMDILRSYASRDLKIVNASKIPGGKSALLAVINKTRRRNGRK